MALLLPFSQSQRSEQWRGGGRALVAAAFNFTAFFGFYDRPSKEICHQSLGMLRSFGWGFTIVKSGLNARVFLQMQILISLLPVPNQ